ncbi:hypothetical protein LPY66_15230 [Dehalobacter sp. DCM]|uniref:hypothetical protein n=1 Tax=Dehalobacter sp. DCM TaxID=2907827 RepID=UPI00308166AE|nr:hypothetical protein LPY66_15230 [Dehalobacter sp. DCM]
MMKRILKVLIIAPTAIIIVTFVLFVLLFTLTPIVHNLTLNSFAKQLDNCPLPAKTELIEKESVCGKLNGNGDGMDYFACILIKSDLSLDGVESYYKKCKFRPAKNRKDYLVDVKIKRVNSEILDDELVEHRDIQFSNLKSVKDYSKYFVVLIYDGGYPAGLDFRGC